MISIIIPAYNEEKRIDKALKELTSRFPNSQIIVIFEGNDKTPEIVKRYRNAAIEINRIRLGKGGSLKKGIQLSSTEKVLLIDADIPVPLSKIDEMTKVNADLVIINRVFKNQTKLRRFLHGGFKFLVKLFFPSLREIKDFQAGMKLVRRDSALKVLDELIINDFLFDINLIYAFKRRGFKIVQITAEYIHDDINSKISKSLLKVIILMFLSLIKLRVYYSPFRNVIYTRPFLYIQSKILELLRP
ncbi:glycosyltransferase [Stygiolobus azoricus]|uniref:Glycosyltransferase n=1 Tax=Stygiolobus azoricus TaxID=41675 RepID=A0A650CLN9_9CREN|nr:glycosyltransferase [Stygiolobus azoricus]QGR18592.1 glycosyltransferase [Stygiolobus azoricus]